MPGIGGKPAEGELGVFSRLQVTLVPYECGGTLFVLMVGGVDSVCMLLVVS